MSRVESGVEDEVLNISRHFSSALLRNRSVVRNALRECGGADGTYKLLNLVEYLLKLPSVRSSLEEITCHGIKPRMMYWIITACIACIFWGSGTS